MNFIDPDLIGAEGSFVFFFSARCDTCTDTALALHCTVHCTALPCALHCAAFAALYCRALTARHGTRRHCTALHCTARPGIAGHCAAAALVLLRARCVFLPQPFFFPLPSLPEYPGERWRFKNVHDRDTKIEPGQTPRALRVRVSLRLPFY